ncbi:hypothetical protein ACJMK2_025531 [Sinanodonta woodiana]|uniref:Uncharacterized protein n=1 Tax=Sinanodonta woodiana TaxID=1069815 RepID=A0ABD3XKJ3_SINWO
MEENKGVKAARRLIWSKLEMKPDEDSADAYIPGVSVPGNRRPSRVQVRKTSEIRAKIPYKQPIVEDITATFSSSKSSLSSVESVLDSKKSHAKKISLKDLNPDDKKRVANLIKELARIGEEREKAVEQLHSERDHFDKQLLKLVDQQEQIVKEREDIQAKLFKCQNLLTQYQSQLLKKQEKLNLSLADSLNKEKKPDANMHSRSHSAQSTPIIRGHKSLFEGQGQSQQQRSNSADIISQRRLSDDRPYTTIIDKEIALHRQIEMRNSQGVSPSISPRLNHVPHQDGRPKFTNRDEIPSLGPLREPIMSSTHKSAELREHLSHDSGNAVFEALIPDQSPRSSIVAPLNFYQTEKLRSHVAFAEKLLEDENLQHHSPNLEKRITKESDHYKNMSPSTRRKELLVQRQALLEEQRRLKDILTQQEQQLLQKKEQIEQRQLLQNERLEFYKENGKFPFNQGVRGEESDNNARSSVVGSTGLDFVRVHKETEDKENVNALRRRFSFDGIETESTDNAVHVRSRISAATSPIPQASHAFKVSMATSPIHSPAHSRTSSGEIDSIPRLVDVATSISYSSRSPLTDAGNKQGNLGMQTNRQRTRNSPREADNNSSTPGEKTLNVLEIINSIDDAQGGLNGSYVTKIASPSRYQEAAITTPTIVRRSPFRMQYSSPSQLTPKQGVYPAAEGEDMEEIRVLEDVFFLK